MKTPVCPYCGKKLSYRALWKSKKYAETCCPFCGKIFSIQYPTVFAVFMGISFAVVILLCIFVPGSVLQVLAPVLLLFYVGLYFALPLFMKIKRITIKTTSGRGISQKEEDVKIYKRTSATKADSKDHKMDGMDGKTVVVSRKPSQKAMSPEERYVAAAVHRAANERPAYETRLHQTNYGQSQEKKKKAVSSRTIGQEEQDFFDHYGG